MWYRTLQAPSIPGDRQHTAVLGAEEQKIRYSRAAAGRSACGVGNYISRARQRLSLCTAIRVEPSAMACQQVAFSPCSPKNV